MPGNMARKAIVAAGHPLTAGAAEHALACGGNAFDAVVAGWFMACLAEPVLTSPAGGGFAMVAPASGRPRLYDFFTQTPLRRNPQAATHPLEADFGSTRQVFHLGAGSVATPGCVAGILRLHADSGSLPLDECAAPARQAAREGLAVSAHAAELMRVVADLYLSTAASRDLFGCSDDPRHCLKEGDRFHNPDFAGFLDQLIAEGAPWFYEGDFGRLVADYCAGHGGHLQREDFEAYRVEIREPLRIRRNGATVYLNPPPSTGGTLIAIGLSLDNAPAAESYPFAKAGKWRGWVDPLRLMTLMKAPGGLAALATDDRRRIGGILGRESGLARAAEALFPAAVRQLRTSGTTQISAMDSDGNEISMTTSNGAGSAIIIPRTGVMLNNMLGEEDLQPDGPGTWQPGTRLSSMMAPALAVLDNGMRIATGSGGSNRIRSTLLQIIRHLVDRRAPLGEAVHAPRLHWENGEVHAETGAFERLEALHEEIGWPLVRHNTPNLFFGGAHSVCRDKDGFFSGIGDPRRGGVAVGR